VSAVRNQGADRDRLISPRWREVETYQPRASVQPAATNELMVTASVPAAAERSKARHHKRRGILNYEQRR